MKSAFLLTLAAIIAVPAQADIFNFNDGYYISSAATFTTIFSGCTSPCYSTPGIYQETQDALHGGVLVTRLSNGSNIPGEYLEDTTPNKLDELRLTGWSQSLNNGQQVANVYNSTNPLNGTVLYLQYTVGAVNPAITPFT